MNTEQRHIFARLCVECNIDEGLQKATARFFFQEGIKTAAKELRKEDREDKS